MIKFLCRFSLFGRVLIAVSLAAVLELAITWATSQGYLTKPYVEGIHGLLFMLEVAIMAAPVLLKNDESDD